MTPLQHAEDAKRPPIYTQSLPALPIRPGYSRPFKSRRNAKAVDKFWLEIPRPRSERLGRMLPRIAMGIGLLMMGLAGLWGYLEVPKHKFREIWYEDFSNGLDLVNDWNHEIALGGFGAGTFDWTTDFANNSFVQDGILYLYPTLTQWPLQQDGSYVNLTEQGICTKTARVDCYAYHNSSSFQIINPVQSARLTTKGKHSIRYGKVELRVKMPRGRYLWPALWLLPENNTYGIWPASGELDIFEGRGDDPLTLASLASQCMQSSAHWGPDYSANPEQTASQNLKLQTHLSCWPRESLTKRFHTYTMEWTPQGITYYIDNPLYIMHHIPFKNGPFRDGLLTVLDSLGQPIPNPWSKSPMKSAPFDQAFYLILNVAVGTPSGWFVEDYYLNPAYSTAGGTGGQSFEAVHDFWVAQHQWYPSWPTDLSRGMAIDWIRMSELVDAEHWESLSSARLDG